MKARIQKPDRVARGWAGYPPGLERLGEAAPASVALWGERSLLVGGPIALFCSIRAPAGVVFGALDLARELAGSTRPIAGGFQSPLEREMLALLLEGTAPLVICPARGIDGLRLPRSWRGPLREGRLLILSPFSEQVRRPTLASSEMRNRVVAALSSRMLVLHASSGGRLAQLTAEALGWGLPVACLDHPSNEDVRVLGARPIVPRGGWSG